MRLSTCDRGQAAVFVLTLATVLFLAVSAALGVVGGHMLDRTRAQTAADAAALAAAVEGRTAAETIARRHGASIVSFAHGSNDGEVIVVVRSRTATAQAAASQNP